MFEVSFTVFIHAKTQGEAITEIEKRLLPMPARDDPYFVQIELIDSRKAKERK